MSAIPEDFIHRTASLSDEVTKPFPKSSKHYVEGSRPDLRVGICGEQGGHPASIRYCHHVGLNYVSCSPPRVPIARLAAAQAKLKEADYRPD